MNPYIRTPRKASVLIAFRQLYLSLTRKLILRRPKAPRTRCYTIVHTERWANEAPTAQRSGYQAGQPGQEEGGLLKKQARVSGAAQGEYRAEKNKGQGGFHNHQSLSNRFAVIRLQRDCNRNAIIIG